MNLKKFLLCLILLEAVVVPQPQPQPQPLVKNLNNQEKAPAFSAPEVKMHENGDRVGHYPPYYQPERGGNRR